MTVYIEAKRLSGSDIGKTISASTSVHGTVRSTTGKLFNLKHSYGSVTLTINTDRDIFDTVRIGADNIVAVTGMSQEEATARA
jgi:hypothetical protein